MEIIKVRIGDLKLGSSPDILRTYSLGSCVAVVLYHRTKKIAAMSHVMLPHHDDPNIKPLGKYANIAIPSMINELSRKGVRKQELVAYLIGGAEMFKVTNDSMKIGKRNSEECKRILNELNIPIVFDETGGNIGRTVDFSTQNGELTVLSLNKKEE